MTRLITVKPPWAEALVRPFDTKNVENRTWVSKHRGLLGIHAGKSISREAIAVVKNPDIETTSAVIGTVNLLEVHKQDDQRCELHGCRENPWAMFAEYPDKPFFHWLTASPRQFVTPIKSTGALSVWEASPRLEHLMSIGETR